MVEKGLHQHTSDLAPDKVGVGYKIFQDTHDFIGSFGIDILVIITSEESAAILGPEIFLNLLDAWSNLRIGHAETGNDIEPCDNGPETILLPDVVAASTKGFFATDGQLVSIKQCAEELPSSWHLVASKAKLLGHQIHGTRSRHAASQTINTILLEIGNQLAVMGDDGKAVPRRDKGTGAIDHVTIAIAVGGSAERDLILLNRLHQPMCIREIGIWVAAVEVGRGLAVLRRIGAQAQLSFKDGLAVGARDARETIKKDLEIGMSGEKPLDQIEIEDVLEHLNVISGTIYHFNL